MASNQTVLEQMLQAALSGGGLRQQGGSAPSAAAPGGSGNLGDILGGLLGAVAAGSAGGPAHRPGAGGSGGLGDLLGGILGGVQPGAATGGAGAGVPAGSDGASAGRPGASGSGGLGDLLGSILGGVQPGAGVGKGTQVGGREPAGQGSPDMRQSQTDEAQGAGVNDLVRYGGMAVIGVLAYQALKRFQAKQGSGQADTAVVPPRDSGFHPAKAPGGADAAAGVFVKAMVAATQADGVIDEEEQRRLVGRLDQLGMNSGDRHALIEQLRTPVDPREIVAAASSPELALQIYAASAMAVRIDTRDERNYLDQLANRLGLDPGLKAQVEQTVGRG
jgi:uncharacterized membrane protein YebE (DUF533 family)